MEARIPEEARGAIFRDHADSQDEWHRLKCHPTPSSDEGGTIILNPVATDHEVVTPVCVISHTERIGIDHEFVIECESIRDPELFYRFRAECPLKQTFC